MLSEQVQLELIRQSPLIIGAIGVCFVSVVGAIVNALVARDAAHRVIESQKELKHVMNSGLEMLEKNRRIESDRLKDEAVKVALASQPASAANLIAVVPAEVVIVNKEAIPVTETQPETHP